MTPKPAFLFSPGGGIGDAIISLPIVAFLQQQVAPYANIDCMVGFSRDIYRDLLGNDYKMFRHVFEGYLPPASEKYAGSLTANELCQWQMSKSFSDLMWAENPKLMDLITFGKGRMEIFGELAANVPYQNNLVAAKAVRMGHTRYTLPWWSLGMPEPYPTPSLARPDRKRSISGDYITFNDGWDGATPGRITKSWSEAGWLSLIHQCRAAGIKIVQLGGRNNGRDYLEADVMLRGQLSFAESLDVLRHSRCHIDIEGGLTHAAAALWTPSVVLFGPTPDDFFGYPQNINLTHGICQSCWWDTVSWHKECPKSNHICMLHNPKEVFGAVQTILSRSKHGNTEG